METSIPQQPQTPTPTQILATPAQTQCKYCHSPVSDNSYFCSVCGKKIKEPPFVFSWGRASLVILESVLIPPLGIFPGIRYLRLKETSAKILGLCAIIITIIMTIVMIIFFVNFFNSMTKTYNDIYEMQGAVNNPSGSVEDQINALQNAGQ